MKKYILPGLLALSLFLVVGAGILDLLVFETNCADNGKGICVDTDDWKMYRWNSGTSAMVAFIDTTTFAANESDPLSAHTYTDASDPAVTDDTTEGFIVGDLWLNATSGAWYVLSDSTDGAAVWSVFNQQYSSDKINEDDTKAEITDDGVSSGILEVTVDGDVVASFSKTENVLGPMAATGELDTNNTYSTTNLMTGLNGGEAIAQWATVYFDGTAGEYLNADANASGKWPADGIAIASSSNANPIYVMTSGFVRYDTWNWTPGGALCLSETAGGIIACSDASICSADGDCAQVIGTAITADVVYFDFTQGWAECNGN